MPLQLATHNGPFHADDVLAWGLITVFLDPDARVIRTRDADRIDASDLVFDVGGRFEPAAGRFDHHQASYQGPLSSAGMVLDWLESEGKLSSALAEELRVQLVRYVDDVDNGRVSPVLGLPCFARIVEAHNRGCDTLEDYDLAFLSAGEVARGYLRGLVAGFEEVAHARSEVFGAMDRARAAGSNLLVLEQYYRWKEAYFAHGGEDHSTEYVVHPGMDGSWRAAAIPPVFGSFAQKRSFPAAWAGLQDGELESITGVPGAVFCHKNRFIAVWKTREGLLRAMHEAGLVIGPLPE